MLLHDARREARTGPAGELVLLEDQDRGALGPRTGSTRARRSLERAMRMRRVGPYQLQAAIAALHDEAATPARHGLAADRGAVPDPRPRCRRRRSSSSTGRWRSRWPTGRRPASRSSTGSPATGQLDDYPYLHAARADLLRRLGRAVGGRGVAYRRALELTANEPERAFLERPAARAGAGDGLSRGDGSGRREASRVRRGPQPYFRLGSRSVTSSRMFFWIQPSEAMTRSGSIG